MFGWIKSAVEGAEPGLNMLGVFPNNKELGLAMSLYFEAGIRKGELCLLIAEKNKKERLKNLLPDFFTPQKRTPSPGAGGFEFISCEELVEQQKAAGDKAFTIDFQDGFWERRLENRTGLRLATDLNCEHDECVARNYSHAAPAFANFPESFPTYSLALLLSKKTVAGLPKSHLVVYDSKASQQKLKIIFPPQFSGKKMRAEKLAELETSVYKKQLMKVLLEDARERYAQEVTARKSLTPQESRIFNMLLLMRSNESISESLGISIYTVKQHLKNIFRKVGVGSRMELVSAFFRHIGIT